MNRRQLSIAGCLALAIVMFGNAGFRRLVRETIRLQKMRKELQSLKDEETSLHEQLHRVQSDDGAVEAMARKELGYVKPGEIEYRFPPPAKDTAH